MTSDDVAPALAFYARRPRRRRLRDRHSERPDGDPREHEVPVSRRARRAAGRSAARLRRTRSAISSSRGGCRSSSGARVPTRRCSRSRSDGTLHEPEVLERQVRRMLADPRSRSLVTNFAFQWLGVRRLDAHRSRPAPLPELRRGSARARSRRRWSCSSTASCASDAASSTCLTANHTFVNERLARHYGLPDVRGDQFRRVELDDSRRFGLFGKGSVLMVTSYPGSHVAGAARRVDHGADARRRRRTRRRPASRRTCAPRRRRAAAPCASGSRCIARSRRAISATASSIRSARRSRTSTRSASGARTSATAACIVDSTGTTLAGQPVNSPDDLRAALLERPDAVRARAHREAA